MELSPLLRLPTELRLNIYRDLLRHYAQPVRLPIRAPRSMLLLVQVNRQLRDESYGFLFRANHIEITGFIGLWWLEEVGPQFTKYLRQVTLSTRHCLPSLRPLSYPICLDLTLNVNTRVLEHMFGNGHGPMSCLHGFSRVTVTLLPPVERRCSSHMIYGHDIGPSLVRKLVRHLQSPCATPCESHIWRHGDTTMGSTVDLNVNMECPMCMA
jgi:hypothetical protein